MKYYDGKVDSFDESTGKIKISCYVDLNTFLKQKPESVRIALVDSRGITDKQRRMIYALIKAIADWVGESTDLIKKQFKLDFRLNQMKGMYDDFSLSNAPESLATDFLSYLVDFIIEHGVPMDRPLIEFVEDIKRYIYACLMNKKCAVCGRKAELHHIDRVGMGNDRDKINHIGKRCLPLCSEHHIILHKLGDKEFLDMYHLSDEVVIDEKIKKVYKL